MELKDLSAAEAHGIVTVTANYDLPQTGATYMMKYEINSDGQIRLSANLEGKETMPEMNRFGVQIPMREDFDLSRFYGRGPQENYSDRKSGAFLGLYQQKASQQAHAYVRPQETGTKSDIRMWQQVNPGGKGLMITSQSPFYGGATNYTVESLDNGDEKTQRHFNEVKPVDYVNLLIDSEQAGVGGIDSWGAHPLEQYRMKPGSRNLSFILTPLYAK